MASSDLVPITGVIGELSEALKDFDASVPGLAPTGVTTQRTVTTHAHNSQGPVAPTELISHPSLEHRNSGPIITKIGGDEAERITTAVAIAPVTSAIQQQQSSQELQPTDAIIMSNIPPAGFQHTFDEAFSGTRYGSDGFPTSTGQESHEVVLSPDGTLPHAITKATTAAFVQGTSAAAAATKITIIVICI